MLDNDVFFSYSHIDNQPLRKEDEGWISSLHHSLQVRLGQLLGREPKIWRDPKLQGNDEFSSEIVDRFTSVAALVCVLSPRYVNSEWCRRELEGFLEAWREKGGPRVGTKSRIFKVTKTEIPRDSQPEALRGLLGYDFFSLDPESGRTREYNLLSGPEAERKYWSRLDDLAYDISQLLQEGQGEGEAAGGGEAEGARVFLAETTFDLKEERDAVKRDLQQQGHVVAPRANLPPLASEIERLVPEALADCRLSVHLVGRNYGLIPEGATQSIVELQNELAIEQAARQDLQRLVWIPPGIEAEDERQRNLLNTLRNDPAAHAGADLLETSLEEFKTAVRDRLAPKPAPAESPDAAGNGDSAQIYLICDRQDLDRTAPLGDLLFERGFDVTLPLFEGDESEVRLDHEENLKLCEAVLIYYGSARQVWLRAKLRELKKIAGYGRTQPMRAKAVYIAQPLSPEKESFRTHEAMVIKSQQEPSPDDLRDFLRALEA